MTLYIKKHPIVYHGERTYQDVNSFLENTLNISPTRIDVSKISSNLNFDKVALFSGSQDSLMSHYFYLSSKLNHDMKYY